jgi:protoporphyrinogen oxidase
MSLSARKERVAVLGAGISGLSAAWFLKQRGIHAQVFEASNQVGGLARSFDWHGIKCDIAPHRLFTDDQETLKTMLYMVPMHAHMRKSKIYMRGKVIRDPINPLELVLKVPVKTAFGLVWSYLFRPKLPEDSFESMALNNFGRGLYDFFFRPYTYKLFGVSPLEISAAWGKQKLRSSGLFDAIKRNSKTFFKGFYYPEKGGYQAISNAFYEGIKDSVILNAKVTGLDHSDEKIVAVKYRVDGQNREFACDRVISTIPITMLGNMLGYAVDLRFKPIKIVYLHINKPQVMPYHWIYFGDGDVVINRMAEFKNFSDDYCNDETTVICAEVTVQTENPLENVLQALDKYHLADRSEVLDSLIIPIQYGYPIYRKGYQAVRAEAINFLGGYKNLHLAGRNAEFRHIDIDENFASVYELVNCLYRQIEEGANDTAPAFDNQEWPLAV